MFRAWGPKKEQDLEDIELQELCVAELHEGVHERTSVWRLAFSLTFTALGDTGTRWKAMGLALAVGFLILAENGVMIYYSEVQKNYMTALQQKNSDGFYHGLWQTAGLICVVIPIIGLHEFTAGLLRMIWRSSMTRRLAGAYLNSDNVFYRLTQTGEIDNPDQRICQDVLDFIETTFALAQDVFGTFLRLLGFTGLLYHLSPRICFGILTYAFVGTLATTWGFGPFISSVQLQTIKQEAGLRYSLIRTRENAESIAFFRGGPAEWEQFMFLFKGLLSTIYSSLWILTGFHMFQRTFSWATFAVAPLLVGPSYLRGEVEFGSISQANMAFTSIMGSLTLVMNRMESLTNCAVRVRRLHALEVALEREERRAARSHNSSEAGKTCIALSQLRPNEAPVLNLDAVTVQTPVRIGATQRTLTQDLTFRLLSGQSLLIVGDSGIGKSSLLRAIAGLWSEGRGSIQMCSGERSVFFLPQRPYMFLGSLRDQLLYPKVQSQTLTEGDLVDALEQVNLGYLLLQHSLWDIKDWSSLLSLGEQQRINFARVLLQKGLRLALVDEGTSACDPATEAKLYSILQERLQSYVSVGHRPALRDYHSHALWLRRAKESATGSGLAFSQEPASWSFVPMAEYKSLAGAAHQA